MIGTSSLRRQVQLRHAFPSIRLMPLRGNVDTRLKKVASGEFDGIVLALAGLKRLGQESRVTQILEQDLMLSAVGQGALGIACRSADAAVRKKLAPLDHRSTRLAVTSERGLLAVLEGSCKVPIAERISGNADTDDMARELGIKLGKQLVERGAGVILAEINQRGASR